jgi:hypothetical protein
MVKAPCGLHRMTPKSHRSLLTYELVILEVDQDARERYHARNGTLIRLGTSVEESCSGLYLEPQRRCSRRSVELEHQTVSQDQS